MKKTLLEAIQGWDKALDVKQHLTDDHLVEDDLITWCDSEGREWEVQFQHDLPSEYSISVNSKYLGDPVYISRHTPSEFRRVYKVLENRFLAEFKN